MLKNNGKRDHEVISGFFRNAPVMWYLSGKEAADLNPELVVLILPTVSQENLLEAGKLEQLDSQSYYYYLKMD